MFYCEADEQVAYQNTFVAYDKFIQNGAVNVYKQSAGLTLDHGACARIALILGKVWFDSLRTDNIKATFVISPESSPGAIDGSITANITGGLQPLQLNWSNGSATSGISGLQGGQYILTIISADSCMRTDTIFVPTVTGVPEQIISEEMIIIYPNPFHVTAELKITGFDLRVYFSEIWLEDLTGKKVKSRIEVKKESVTIYREDIRNGFYLVRMRGKAGEAVKRVMIY
jgi:hypothetical protein